ncbi:MAG: amino acid adenylation domain-containing protein [Flavobacteriales bacterium]|nr:amino acid adenylation domain-containing protein [Flavobacteriales bacterium]
MEKFIQEPRYVPVDFDPFAGPPIAHAIPTTEAQREVFVASEMGNDASCAYNESISLQLKGTLDRPALEQAVQDLLMRHEALRSTLSASGTRLIVHEYLPVELHYEDLVAEDDPKREGRLRDIARVDMSTPFDLLKGPLVRIQLLRIANDEHLLRITGHHVVCDGWSLGIIILELGALYSAHSQGRPAELPPASRFSDYSLAMIDIAKGPEHERVERYWLDLFSAPIPRVDLPTDHVRPRQKTYRGDRVDLELRPELIHGLREVSTRYGASFVTTLLTAFELLLHKLTGDSDLVVGLPAAGQSDLGMKHLVGHCVNLLALRSQVDEDRTFHEHLKLRRTGILDAFENQRYTFGTLVHRLNVPREPGRIPLCPVVFNVDMNLDEGVAFQGLSHRLISNPRRFENFELFLNATGSGDDLVLEWCFNTDLLDRSTILSWMKEFEVLIARITRVPQATIAELVGDQEPGSEHKPVPAEWQGVPVPFPHDKSISQVFDAIVAAHPGKVALELGDLRLTYAQLHQRVLHLASALKVAGVGPGQFVGVCCERDFSMVAAQLAILRVGAAFVPLDQSYPSERLAFMIEDTGLQVILSTPELAVSLPAHNARLIKLDGTSPSGEVADVAPKDSPEAAAYVMYTSGSTGKPKGVVVPQRAIVRLVRDQNYAPFGPDVVITQLSNVSFDASTFELWGALLNGGRLVLQPQAKPTLAEIAETIQRHGVNTMFITPALFNLLVDEQLHRLKGLKCILVGGEVMSVPHTRKALSLLGPGVLNNIYGPTENTTFSCYHPVNREEDIGRQIPIGRPIHNSLLYVLGEDLLPVPIGVKGELYCGGPGVALGYLNRPELTAERFLPDPFAGNGATMYRTGDLVRWLPDGKLEFIGRADDQVKVRGFRIELGEIENAISTMPGVRDRVMMARRDLPGDHQLVAYVVPSEFDPATDHARRDAFADDLREHLRQHLPAFMLPAFIVPMTNLPLNANGKVEKKLLPKPEPRTVKLQARHVAPRNATERMLAIIWSDVLKLQDVGVHDNFFELGGHSMTGIHMLSQVEQRLGRTLSLKAIFKAPTIADLAKLIDKEEPGDRVETHNLVAIREEGMLPPLFCVHGDEANYYLPQHLDRELPFYAFTHQGEDGLPIRYTRVEEIAAHFIAELRSMRPKGPYLLSGYSFGGLVAYEMAVQLTAEGEEIPLVALFDTFTPDEHLVEAKREARWTDNLKNPIIRKMYGHFLKRGKVIPPKLRHYHIIDTYERAIAAYTPKPYGGHVVVFRAEATHGPEYMGWKRFVKGHLELRMTPGNHYDMIKEPHVRVLASQLSESVLAVLRDRSIEAV